MKLETGRGSEGEAGTLKLLIHSRHAANVPPPLCGMRDDSRKTDSLISVVKVKLEQFHTPLERNSANILL